MFKKLIKKTKFYKKLYNRGLLPVPLNILIINLLYQKILRINSTTSLSINFRSTVIQGNKVEVGLYSEKSLAITPGLYIQGGSGIIIGDNVLIGPNTSLISSNHDPNNRSQWVETSPIKIGNNVWIGANVVILPSVTIGNNSIVGAGSVVTKNIPSDSIFAGNPAKEISKK